MNKGDAVVIEKVLNGYMVTCRIHNGEVIDASSAYVFQDMGYASSARDNQPVSKTLLGFIEDHFGGQQ